MTRLILPSNDLTHFYVQPAADYTVRPDCRFNVSDGFIIIIPVTLK